MSSTNQSTNIKNAITSYLDQGLTDRTDIYNKVVEDLGVPRPTVRRVARDLRTELLEKIQQLEDNAKGTEKKRDRTLKKDLQNKMDVLKAGVSKSETKKD